MAVVVVESPAKAKTINKYLGPGFTVLASYGHVRDLPPKDGSVDPDNQFEMLWEVAPESQKHVRAIAEALKTDDKLILATDPDREGEAISWHLLEALTKRKAVKKTTEVERVVFNAITKSAVTTAMQHPRQIDMELVEAYLARRALDYLVGFKLSPVLWRKLPGAKSAGRVQSVALRLIVDREMEIEAFKTREYWTVSALLATPRGQEFTARLVSLAGKRLEKFDLATALEAEMAVAAITSRDLTVRAVEAKPASRNPSAPFMTSTLQQEASRKFGFGARQTMSTAQRLYEAGTHHLHAHRRHRHGARGGDGRARRDQGALRRAPTCRSRRACTRTRPRTPRKPTSASAPPTWRRTRARWAGSSPTSASSTT